MKIYFQIVIIEQILYLPTLIVPICCEFSNKHSKTHLVYQNLMFIIRHKHFI